MAKDKARRSWLEPEIVVLCAVFCSIGFSAGDDEREECRAVAKAFGRSPGTIDRQWRNIKDYLAGYEVPKVGVLVKTYADHTLHNPRIVKTLARYYCKMNGWELLDLIS